MSISILGPHLPPFTKYLQQQASSFGTRTTRRSSFNMSSTAAMPPSSLSVQPATPAKSRPALYLSFRYILAIYLLLSSSIIAQSQPIFILYIVLTDCCELFSNTQPKLAYRASHRSLALDSKLSIYSFMTDNDNRSFHPRPFSR